MIPGERENFFSRKKGFPLPPTPTLFKKAAYFVEGAILCQRDVFYGLPVLSKAPHTRTQPRHPVESYGHADSEPPVENCDRQGP